MNASSTRALPLPLRWSIGRRVKNGAIYAVVRVALAAARMLPTSVAMAMGRLLGHVAWFAARGARRMAIENVGRAYPDRTAEDCRRLARRSFVELGTLLGDVIALFDLRTVAASRLPFGEDARRVLDAAFHDARLLGAPSLGSGSVPGVVLVTAHLGPWERLAACLTESGYALTTPVRRSYDPRLEALVHAPLRARRGVMAIDRDAPSTPRALLRALREGGIAGFLVDLNTRVASVSVPFLGHDAWTAVAPARMALRTGAPVVVALATRQGVHIELLRAASAPMRGPIDDAAIALTREISVRIGTAILAEPDRWIWMHDRWGQARQAKKGVGEPTATAGV